MRSSSKFLQRYHLESPVTRGEHNDCCDSKGKTPDSGHNIGFLDCGKRGGAEILKEIKSQLRNRHSFADSVLLEKTSAHRMASKKLIEEIADRFDALVYGVVN